MRYLFIIACLVSMTATATAQTWADDKDSTVRDHRGSDDSDDSDDSDSSYDNDNDDSDDSTWADDSHSTVRDHRSSATTTGHGTGSSGGTWADDSDSTVRDHRSSSSSSTTAGHDTGSPDTGADDSDSTVRDHRNGRPGDGRSLDDVREDIDDLFGTINAIRRLSNAGADHGPSEASQIYRDVRSDWITLSQTLGLKRLYKTHRHWSVYGAVLAESTRYLGVGVGGELAWDAPLCRFAGAGFDSQLFRDPDDNGITYAGFATACLPMLSSALEFSYHFQRQVRPNLASRPILLSRRYNGDTFGLHAHNFKWRTDTLEIAFSPADIELGWFRQDDPMGEQKSFYAGVDVDMLRILWLGRGFLEDDSSLGILSLRFAVRAGDDDIAPELSSDRFFIAPIRVQGVPLGKTGAYLDGAIGWARGRLYETIGPQEIQEVSAKATLGAELSVRAGTREQRYGVHFERMPEPTFNRLYLIDDRIAGWFFRQVGRRSTLVEGFAASTIAYDESDNASERMTTGGVSVEQAFLLGEHLSFSVRGDAARSFYADEDSGPGAPEWAFRLMAVMSSQLSSDQSD